jgi:5-methylcytosine-specific restriction endonuclease McrA
VSDNINQNLISPGGALDASQDTSSQPAPSGVTLINPKTGRKTKFKGLPGETYEDAVARIKRESTAKYRKKYPEKIKAYKLKIKIEASRVRELNKKPKISEKEKRLKRAKTHKEYVKTHKNEIILMRKKWNKNNIEKIKSSKERSRVKRKDKIREYNHNFYIENKEKILARNDNWAKLNPESRQNSRVKRRLRGGNNKISKGLVKKLINLQSGKCAYFEFCGSFIESGKYHADHIVPLMLGGKHEDFNIQLTCPTCNLRKNAKHPDVFLAELKAEKALRELCNQPQVQSLPQPVSPATIN